MRVKDHDLLKAGLFYRFDGVRELCSHDSGDVLWRRRRIRPAIDGEKYASDPDDPGQR